MQNDRAEPGAEPHPPALSAWAKLAALAVFAALLAFGLVRESAGLDATAYKGGDRETGRVGTARRRTDHFNLLCHLRTRSQK